MKKVVAIYHKDCSDGTAAAAVILKKYPEAKVFPLAHAYKKEDLDPILSLIDSETNVYTVDCALAIDELLLKGIKVTTIDHHISPKENCEKIAKENPNYTFVFDINKSGASLSWSYFFPDLETPELIRYIEDFDLWKNKLGENTKFVANYLVSFRDNPNETLKFFDTNIDEILQRGKIVSNYVDYTVCDEVANKPIKLKIGEYLALGYNISSVNSSVCGSILSEKSGQAFVGFRIDGDKVKYSVRSKEGQSPSALDLASILGGGGHKNSSGAATTLKKFLEMIVLE